MGRNYGMEIREKTTENHHGKPRSTKFGHILKKFSDQRRSLHQEN